MPVRGSLDAHEEARRGLLQQHRLHDHRGDLASVLIEGRFQRREVVVGKRNDEIIRALGNPLGARRRHGMPVMPSVIAAREQQVASGRGAGHADGGRIGLGTGLEKAHPLSAGDQLHQPLGDLHLEGMGQ